MGYESKILIVITSPTSFPEVIGKKTYQYSSVIAKFDLCKLGNSFHTEILNKAKKTNCFFYADDGDTRVLEDKYGDPIKELNFNKFLKYLKKAEAEGHYRRFPPIIGTLEALKADREHWGWKDGDYDQIKILHYGY